MNRVKAQQDVMQRPWRNLTCTGYMPKTFAIILADLLSGIDKIPTG